jgi:short-subunit dehydrogenase
VAGTRIAGSDCLVTGATSGIGRASALELAWRGAHVVLSGRDEASLAAVAEATRGRAIAADLTEPGAAARLAADAGRVDVLVHAAGAGALGALGDESADDLARLVALNVTAPLVLTAALLPAMLERRLGHVVLLGSIAGRVGRGREAAYAATKAAVSVFADSLQQELRGTGVGVSLITPGAVDTAFFERRGAAYDRSWPRPIPAERVAAALADAIESDRTEVTLPRWHSLAVRARGAAPALYRALAARFD